jgi:glycerol kinase
MERVIIGIDQSTTSTKVQVFSDIEELLFSTSLPHTQIYPQTGWIEHDPQEILTNTLSCLGQCLEHIHTKLVTKTETQIFIGITNQRETLVAWSRSTGKPLCNAIVWNDARTQDICRKEITCQKGDADAFQSINGLRIAEYFSVFKLRWMLENYESVRKAMKQTDLMVGTIDSWLLYNLSSEGNHFTDVTNASRTFLMDLNSLEYSPELVKHFGIDPSVLPQIKPNVYEFGTIDYSKFFGTNSSFKTSKLTGNEFLLPSCFK